MELRAEIEATPPRDGRGTPFNLLVALPLAPHGSPGRPSPPAKHTRLDPSLLGTPTSASAHKPRKASVSCPGCSPMRGRGHGWICDWQDTHRQASTCIWCDVQCDHANGDVSQGNGARRCPWSVQTQPSHLIK